MRRPEGTCHACWQPHPDDQMCWPAKADARTYGDPADGWSASTDRLESFILDISNPRIDTHRGVPGFMVDAAKVLTERLRAGFASGELTAADLAPPAAPAVSPEPGHDGHTHDVGPVKVWRCILSAPDCLGVDDANRLHIGCGWVDAVPSPEPERETCPKCDDDLYDGRCGGCLRYPLDGSNCHCEPEPDEPLNAYEDTDGDQGEDAVRERQYERDHGIEP